MLFSCAFYDSQNLFCVIPVASKNGQKPRFKRENQGLNFQHLTSNAQRPSFRFEADYLIFKEHDEPPATSRQPSAKTKKNRLSIYARTCAPDSKMVPQPQEVFEYKCLLNKD